MRSSYRMCLCWGGVRVEQKLHCTEWLHGTVFAGVCATWLHIVVVLSLIQHFVWMLCVCGCVHTLWSAKSSNKSPEFFIAQHSQDCLGMADLPLEQIMPLFH